jgi:hypothetical protein
MEDEQYPYQKEWEDYYKRENSFHRVFILFFPFLILLWLVTLVFFRNFEWVFSIGFIAALLYVFILRHRLVSWCCPRCGTRFWNKNWFSYSVSDKCRNCELLKDEGSFFKLNY